MFGLSSLFRKRAKNHFNTVHQTEQWLTSTLHPEDDYESQRLLTDALSQFLKSAEPLTRERLKILLRLDESSQPFQTKLAARYFRHTGDPTHAEDALWKSMMALYWHLAHAYQAFIREVIANRGKSENGKYLSLIITRAIHYFGRSIEWGYFHGDQVQSLMWKRLHKLLILAESSGFAATEVKLASGRQTNCTAEYMHILLLDMVKPAALRAQQIHLVDGWLESWRHSVQLERNCDLQTHMHCVDLSTGTGARKLLEGMESGKLRCWSMAGIYGLLRKVRNDLAEGRTDGELKLGTHWRAEEYVQLLDYVARYWIRPEAARKLERSESGRVVEMACGVGAIHRCLQHADDAAPEIHEKSIPYEHWAVENESVGGYGLIEARASEKAEEGKLVCVKPAGNSAEWEIGVIRWMKNAESGQPELGIEKLSNSPKHVKLSPTKPGQLPGAGEIAPIKAVFLPKIYERDVDSSIIFLAPEYTPGASFDMTYRQNIFRIRLSEALDTGDDWVRVKFEILGNRPLPKTA